MNYLLDTHAFIWWVENDKKLLHSWRNIISDSDNLIYVSVVSAWEMSIKLRTKKLKLKTSFGACFDHLEFDLIDITLLHIQELHKLPFHHKDPFDRMLIAQARVEGCTLITVDKKMYAYGVPIFDTRA